MKTILEFPLEVADFQNLIVPAGSTPIHAGTNPQGRLSVWFLTDQSQPPAVFKLWMFAPRQPIPHDLAIRHFATVKYGAHEDFIRMWHIFIRA